MIRVVGRAGFNKELTEEITVGDLLTNLGLMEQSYVCVRNGTPVTRFDTIRPEDDVTFLEIFSGG